MSMDGKVMQEWCKKYEKFNLIGIPECVKNYLSTKELVSEVTRHVARIDALGWSAAHHVLSLCYYCLRQSQCSHITNELCLLLDTCVSACSDVDVQDRARMYLTLLHTLSELKLKEILHVPGPGVGSLFSGDTELQLASAVKHLKEPVLHLCKQPTTYNTVHTDTQVGAVPQDILKTYFELLSQTAVDVQCIVKRANHFSADVQALVLYFSVPDNWGSIDDVMVGHVSMEAEAGTLIRVRCYPQKPVPVTANISAEFSIDNVIHTCPLTSLDLELSDLFQQLLMPGELQGWHRAVFDELWTSLAVCGYTAPYVDKDRSNVLSKVKQYVIGSAAGEETLAAIFLPPRHHLLLKLTLHEDCVFVQVRTDFVQLLTYFNHYISNA